MNKIKIWRVENTEGEGCYKFEITKDILDWDNTINHPTPPSDKGIGRCVENKEICGFKDEEQARKWFSEEELKGLKKLGYELKIMEVEKITVIGEKQVLAIR